MRKVVNFLAIDSESGVIASLDLISDPDQIIFSRLDSEEETTAHIEFPADLVSMALESVSAAKIDNCYFEIVLRTHVESAIPISKQIAIPPPVCIR